MTPLLPAQAPDYWDGSAKRKADDIQVWDGASLVRGQVRVWTGTDTILIWPVSLPAPTGLSVSLDATNPESAVDLSWDAAPSDLVADSIRVEQAPDSGGAPGAWSQIASLGTGTTTHAVTGLADGVTYWYRILYAVDLEPLLGATSTEVQITTGGLAPQTAPTISAAPAAGTSSVLTVPVGVSQPASGTVSQNVGTSGSWDLTGRPADTSHWCRARGVNADGDGPWSGWVQAYTHVDAPALSFVEDLTNCPTSYALDLTLDHTNTDGDARSTGGTIEVTTNNGSTWTQEATFSAGQTSLSLDPADSAWTDMRASYTGETATDEASLSLVAGCAI